MRCATKTRPLIAQHAPWFKLSKYDELEDASPAIWYTQLALRIDLQRIRSMLVTQGHPLASMHRTVHQGSIALLRNKGVLRGGALKHFLAGEEFLYPETFSTFRALNQGATSIREMTLDDYNRVGASLNPHGNGPASFTDESVSTSAVSSEPLSELVRHSMLSSSDSFLTVDLRCPRALLVRQVAELVDKLQRDRVAWLPAPKQTKLPAFAAWRRSHVLPYLDLRQWLDTTEDIELRETVTDAALADALEIDPKQLSETTKKHAEELTDPLSWTFMHLAETAISSFRGAVRPVRNTKRTAKTQTNNA